MRRAAVVTHGKPETIGPALACLEHIAREVGVELVLPGDERQKHGLGTASADPGEVDLAVVLGGDGTILRALARFLDTSVPVIGVNFGRVGFLASIGPDELEPALRRVFAGEYTVFELTTLEAEVGGERAVAVNDIVCTSSSLGRMVELSWAIGGEDLGVQPCDGVICSTPTGSTAYNLSNGGPVLMRGLEAMAITFVAPHSLAARPLVVPHGLDLTISNLTADVAVTVIADGHQFATIEASTPVTVRLGDQRGLLAALPETTFIRRYRETFAS